MGLDDARIQRFLDGGDIVVLATVQPDAAPLAMPMWFLHDPAALAMISVAGTQKVRNLRRDPRVCVVAERGARGDVRGVSVHGRAEFLSDGPERAGARRPLPREVPPAPRAALGRPGDAGRPRDVPNRPRARACLGARLTGACAAGASGVRAWPTAWRRRRLAWRS